MEELIYILKIIFYFIFVFAMYRMALNSSKYNKNQKLRISIICIIIFCCIMGYYSIICGKYPYASDRKNFAFRFASDIFSSTVKQESLGLYWIESFLHIFTYEPKVLFFVCSFLYLFLTLVAYNLYDDAEPFAILMIGLSPFLTYGFYMLKQAIAVALIAIAFAAYSKNKKFLFVISTLLAICFHESAWLIVVVYLAFTLTKNKFLKMLEYFILIVFLVFFEDINGLIIRTISIVIPNIGNQLSYYLDDSGNMIGSSNFLTILKGLPFYFITAFAFLKRKSLIDKIKNYDNYIFLCIFASFTFLLSSFMYWMFRFGLYCYFPIFIFSSLILRELQDSKDRNLFGLGLCVSFFYLTLRLWIQYYFIYGGM